MFSHRTGYSEDFRNGCLVQIILTSAESPLVALYEDNFEQGDEETQVLILQYFKIAVRPILHLAPPE
jgi:hypothetical protein